PPRNPLRRVGRQFLGTLMEPSRQQPERAVIRLEDRVPLLNPPLAEQHRLPPGGNRRTDRRPFFEEPLAFPPHGRILCCLTLQQDDRMHSGRSCPPREVTAAEQTPAA